MSTNVEHLRETIRAFNEEPGSDRGQLLGVLDAAEKALADLEPPPNLSERDAAHWRILRALDLSIQQAAQSRGLAACDGKDDHQECEISELHTRAGELAGVLASQIADPSPWNAGRVVEAASAFVTALVEAYGDKPQLS